jgi:hypothetical protein
MAITETIGGVEFSDYCSCVVKIVEQAEVA